MRPKFSKGDCAPALAPDLAARILNPHSTFLCAPVVDMCLCPTRACLAARKDGHKLLEVDFPPLPQDLSCAPARPAAAAAQKLSL